MWRGVTALSQALEAEVEADVAALGAGLFLVAGRLPSGIGLMPAARALGREPELRRAQDMGEGPVRIILDVGCEAEDRARPQRARQFAQRKRRDEAALVVAGL